MKSNQQWNAEFRKRDQKLFCTIIWRVVHEERVKNGLPNPDDREAVRTLFYHKIQVDNMPEGAKLGNRKLMWEKVVRDCRDEYREYFNCLIKNEVAA
jgi:hypothetical protein